MPRRRTGRRRGRPRQLHARHRATTRAGRRGIVINDLGTEQLQQQRRLATHSTDLPIDPLGVLYGRKLIETAHYNAGRDLGELLETARRDLGRSSSPQVAWLAILGVRGGVAGDDDPAAEYARRVLARLFGRLEPDIRELTVAIAEGAWLPFLTHILAGVDQPDTVRRLRRGLGQVARSWSRSRPPRKLLDAEVGGNDILHA